MNEITVQAFVRELWNRFGNCEFTDEQLFNYGRTHFWLEDQDEAGAGELLQRRSAARIIHQFIKIEMHIPDSQNIDEAKVLTDLFTCRVCVEHVAQVYVKRIITAHEIQNEQGDVVTIFDMLGTVTKKNADEIFERINHLHSSI